LVGERGPNPWSDIVDAAKLTRQQQLSRIMNLVKGHILEEKQPLFLVGDFNATPDEYAIKDYLEKEVGFQRLVPKNPISTHPNAGIVDHILFSPSNRIKSYQCWIEDDEIAHIVSDHLPVVADVVFL
jgi:endonuclease/exonuclease/phosphatase family metal-dependent hydrolase